MALMLAPFSLDGVSITRSGSSMKGMVWSTWANTSTGEVRLLALSFCVNYIVIHEANWRTIMAANQLVQTRIDGVIKEEAAAVLAAMGLTVSDAVRLLLTKVAQDKALPFEPLVPNATTIEAMKQARKGKLPRFATVNDLMTDLHAAD